MNKTENIGQFERELEESLEGMLADGPMLAALGRVPGLEDMAEDAGRKLDAYEAALVKLRRAVKDRGI